MTTVIIGSAALKHHFPETREPKDLDIFSDENIRLTMAGEHQGKMVENFWDPAFSEYFTGYRFATIDELYTVKHSHAYWELKNNSWDKHIFDLLFLQKNGAELLPELHNLLYKVWEKRHGKKVMNLAMAAGDFFDDAVVRLYDHDSIHYSVAYTPGKPIYESVLKDGETVDIDPEKLWNLPFISLVNLFREEIYATALERILIPSSYRQSAGRAYQWALRRTVTSLTKGKSARFIVTNISHFVRPDFDYLQHHLNNSHYLIPLEAK